MANQCALRTFAPCQTLITVSQGVNAAFKDGQQSFLDAEATGGLYNATYYEALAFAQRNSRADGIVYALTHLSDGSQVQLDGLLIPSDPSSAAQNLVSQAGYPTVTIPVAIDPWGELLTPQSI